MEGQPNPPTTAAQAGWECPQCYDDREPPNDERFVLVDERRPDDDDVDRTPNLYCGYCVKRLLQLEFNNGGATLPLRHMEIDDYARLFTDDPEFVARYKEKEDQAAIFPLWTRILCSACQRLVGQSESESGGSPNPMLNSVIKPSTSPVDNMTFQLYTLCRAASTSHDITDAVCTSSAKLRLMNNNIVSLTTTIFATTDTTSMPNKDQHISSASAISTADDASSTAPMLPRDDHPSKEAFLDHKNFFEKLSAHVKHDVSKEKRQSVSDSGPFIFQFDPTQGKEVLVRNPQWPYEDSFKREGDVECKWAFGSFAYGTDARAERQ
ncbi:hypothetical protein M409DRAFT_61250 [Zasmidium cellare ATCC 36951]|uniref:Uncharacterized protein n=1 Tax=Zasmidium cellare ATCC 36951 TaxID=1080233 RepID=A0A6A6BVQ4_ZASCE|nr:uncharacterized protein M409DRAFT_61250 [Zasmidium cellare ATCC 36951]KAF2158904.1 hypothetical protein M409DRAFT_61250 [Zasmidium cellare ATCC 36951]